MKDTHTLKLSEKYIDIYKDKKISKNIGIYRREREGGGRDRERERERERERGGQLGVEIAQAEHTQEMQASVAGLNCLAIVTEFGTKTTTATAAVITTTTTITTGMPRDWRWLVHHKSGNLWSFVT